MASKGTVGVVGTGIMGAPMAVNLAKAGYDVVAFNRTPAKAEAIAGERIRVARSVAEVGSAAPIVITMVPDTPDVLEAVEGPGGLAGSMAAGSVLIDMSTIAPGATRELAARLRERGIAMLDAPVSGGSWGAQEGTLTKDSISDIAIPDGVREALGRRLNRISEEANELLQIAAVAALGVAVSAASGAMIQIWFRAQAKRSNFRRRQVSSRVATVAEALSSILWAGTAVLAAAGSWFAAATALLALLTLAATWAIRPRRKKGDILL